MAGRLGAVLRQAPFAQPAAGQRPSSQPAALPEGCGPTAASRPEEWCTAYEAELIAESTCRVCEGVRVPPECTRHKLDA